MSIRKLFAIILVFLGLLVLMFVKQAAIKKAEAPKKESEPEVLTLTDELSSGFISGITVYKGDAEDKKIVFEKDSAGNWSIQKKFGLKARKEAVEALLKELTGLSGEVRGDSKDVFPDFAITDTQGIHIILGANAPEPLLHLVVSFTKPAWNMNFIRLFDSEKIVLVSRDILSRLNLYSKDAALDDTYFADFKALDLDINSVRRLVIKKGADLPIILEKREGKDPAAGLIWQFEGGGTTAVDPARVEEYLQHCANMYAMDSLDPKGAAYGFDNPFMTVSLFLQQQNEQVDIVIASYVEAKKAYNVRISSSGLVLLVPESFISSLKKDRPFFIRPKETKDKKKR